MTHFVEVKPARDERCPRCGSRFSDWFVWEGRRHCFQCWADTDFEIVVIEDSNVQGEEERDG